MFRSGSMWSTPLRTRRSWAARYRAHGALSRPPSVRTRRRDQRGLVRRPGGAATSQIAYTASKGAVLSMSRELAVQFAHEDVRVNAVCPGPVGTPLLMRLFADDPVAYDRRRVYLPIDRLARARNSQRRAVSRRRRLVLRQRVDVPGRRRADRRVRDPRVGGSPPRSYMGAADTGGAGEASAEGSSSRHQESASHSSK